MPMITIELDSSTSTSVTRNSFTIEKVMETIDLDKALALTGYGRFHYEIIASSGFSLLSSGLQNGLAAYVLPAAHCELHLSSSEIGFVNAAFLVGATCSSFLWGILADLTGRRKVLVTTLLFDVVITFVSSLMQDFWGLLACRFLTGFLIGAPGSLTFTYIAEFYAPQHRSKMIYYSGVFYTLSWLLLPIVAWMILPFQVEIELQGFVICSSWRIFLALLTIPELIAGLWIWYLPESPKFLANKNAKEALNVLKEMYSKNTGNRKDDYPVKSLINDVKILNLGSTSNVNCRGKIARLVQDVCVQLRNLFSAPLLVYTLLISGIMFSNMFGYFGLGLWLPEFLTRLQDQNSSSTSIDAKNDTNITLSNDSCLPQFDSSLFTSTVSIGICCLLGNLLSGWFAEKFDKNVIPFVTMLAGAISSGSFYWLGSSLENLMAACIFQSTMSTANIVIGGVVVDLFPTAVNAMAICTAMFAGRVASIFSNILFGFLMDACSEIAIFVVAGVLLFGASLCLLIPNKINKDPDLLQEYPERDKVNLEVSIISVTSM